MTRPLSIRLFALLYALAALIALAMALHAARTISFGFQLAPEAAETLAFRILMIRMFGFIFALSLMLLVVVQRSRAARSALGLRWLLGFATSVPFLRGIGVVAPIDHGGMMIIAIGLVQLLIEGLAILLLYGEDAADWFPAARFGY